MGLCKCEKYAGIDGTLYIYLNFYIILFGIPSLHLLMFLFSWNKIASFPASCAGEEEREPGTYCSHMCQVPLVTCILLHYTKIMVNFCLPADRPHCMVILPIGHVRAVLKSKTISL